MNARERVLAVVLVVVILGVGGFLGSKVFYFDPLGQRQRTIEMLARDIETRQKKINDIVAARPRLERWRQLSLPGDPDVARREYEKYLSELLRESGFAAGNTSVMPRPPDSKSAPTLTNKTPIYTRLTFAVVTRGTLGNLVDLLDRFYHTGLLHQVKHLSVRRPLTTGPQQRAEDLDIDFTAEALVITGVNNRPYLLPNIERRLVALDALAALRKGPVGLAFVPWVAGPTGPFGPGTLADPPRQYAAIGGKNIFTGPPPRQQEPTAEEVATARFVHLTDITHDGKRSEAFLYDRLHNLRTRLRAETGFNIFRIQDDQGDTVVRGRVLSIGDREVTFRVEDESWNQVPRAPIEEEVWSRLLRERRVQAEDREYTVRVERAALDQLRRGKVLHDVRVRGERLIRIGALLAREIRGDDDLHVYVRVYPYYAFQIGHTLEEALDTVVPEDRVKALGLAAAP